MKQLTETQVEEIIADTGWDLGVYDEDKAPALTADTLADFAQSAGRDWKYNRSKEYTTTSGIKVVAYEGVQVRAGDTRFTLVIADMGDYRIAGRC